MSLEQIEQPKTSEKNLTPEMIEELKAKCGQEETAFHRENEKYLKKTGKIENEEMRKLALARLGLVSVRLAEINQELMIGLN